MCDHRIFGRGEVINGNDEYRWSAVGFRSIKRFIKAGPELLIPPSPT
jgi:hypothetical protein